MTTKSTPEGRLKFQGTDPERDADHDIADMLVDKSQILKEEAEKQGIPIIDMPLVKPHVDLKELFLHMLWVTENEGQFGDGEFEIARDYIEAHIPGEKDADLHRDPIFEDRYSKLFRTGQRNLGGQNSMDRCQPRTTAKPGCSCRQSHPLSESCQGFATSGAWGKD